MLLVGMFVRFVVPTVDKDSGRRQGVFQQAYALRRAIEPTSELHKQLDETLAWLDGQLKVPERFTRGKRKSEPGLAVSWFKDSALGHIAHMRVVCRMLSQHGIHTEMLSTDRPGYIVFEDDHQVAAVPFTDTPT
jgi:hypothetical protein